MKPICATCRSTKITKMPKKSFELDDKYKCSDCGNLTAVYNEDARRKREI